MAWKDWSLGALLDGANKVSARRSNAPSVRDLEGMLDAFQHWHDYYDADAKKHRERHAKLELIQDRDAIWEKRARDSAEADAARCLVGIRTLKWAISDLSKT